MLKQGEKVNIEATVLRVEGSRLDAQTANGQLIQTHVDNARVSQKSVGLQEHKAVLNASENKSRKK